MDYQSVWGLLGLTPVVNGKVNAFIMERNIWTNFYSNQKHCMHAPRIVTHITFTNNNIFQKPGLQFITSLNLLKNVNPY